MNRVLPLCLASLCFCTLAGTAFAQELSFDNGAVTFGAGSFTTELGVSTLTLPDSGAHYFSDLNSTLNLPTNVATSLGLTGSGWVFQESTGEIIITSTGQADTAADPFAAYGFFTINNTSSQQSFSTSLTSTFSSTSFTNSSVDASFGLTLTSTTGANVTVQATQTGVLSNSGASPAATGSPINLGSLMTPIATSSTTTTSSSLTGELGPVGGPFNQLTVSASGTYSPSAIVTLSGRVDVEDVTTVPEPSSFAFLAVTALGALLFHLRRFARRF